MGRMTFEEAQRYENEPCYFSLPNDGDSVKVKFLFDSMKDIYLFLVHSVKYNGKYLKVECLRDSLTDEREKCPICASGVEPYKKYYIPLYNLTEDKFQYWERGKLFTSKLVSLCSEYYPLSNEVFEITRVGARGSRDTDYRIENITYEYTNKPNAKHLDFTINDLDVPDCMDPEAGIVIDRSFEDLEYYAENGVFKDDTFDYNAYSRNSNNTAERYNSRKRYNTQDNNTNYRTRNSNYSSRSNYEEEEEDTYESRVSSRRREF